MEILNNRYKNVTPDVTWTEYQAEYPSATYADYQADFIDPTSSDPGGAGYDDVLNSIKNTSGTLNSVTNSLKNFFGMVKGDTSIQSPYVITPGMPVTTTNYTPFIIAGVVGVGLIFLLSMTKNKT